MPGIVNEVLLAVVEAIGTDRLLLSFQRMYLGLWMPSVSRILESRCPEQSPAITPGIQYQSLVQCVTAGADNYRAMLEAKSVFVVGDAPVQLQAVEAFLLQAGQQVAGPVDTEPARFYADIHQKIMRYRRARDFVLLCQLLRILDRNTCGKTCLMRIDVII